MSLITLVTCGCVTSLALDPEDLLEGGLEGRHFKVHL